MPGSLLTLSFAVALCASLLVKFWLATRQVRHVIQHRHSVPAVFAASVTPQAHAKAADYTVAKARFGLLTTAFGAMLLVGWTLLGGLDLLNALVRDAVQPRLGDLAYQLALVTAFSVISGLLDWPFELYSKFRLEQRFGFNRMTWRLYLADMLRNLLVATVVMLPLVAGILWLMQATGPWWWLLAWGLWVAFVLLMQVIAPTLIAPLYNQFKPLDDERLRAGVVALMTRCGYAAKDIFVMDGSKRSGHSNAYFTGMGVAKRVVFFDTLVDKLTPREIEAVLAHELGHLRHKHMLKRIVALFAMSLAGFALLGWLSEQVWFYTALGAQPSLTTPNSALALLLFLLVVPVFGFFVAPVFAQLSRQHEFQADAYACAQSNRDDLAAALLKLYEHNAATLTPDPWYVRFFYSHPPASERLAALLPGTAPAL